MDDVGSISGAAIFAVPLITIGTFSFVTPYQLFRYGYIRLPRIRGRKRSKLSLLLIKAASN